jgi:uncharacterized protein
MTDYNNLRLRGHHLLCLLGYRGMGYSPAFCDNMTGIYEQLRQQPETVIEIVHGPDDICAAYPDNETKHCEGSVYELDTRVLDRLGLTTGSRLSWQEALTRVGSRLVPDDIGKLCTSCPWEHYGVCRDGVRMVGEGLALPAVPARITSSRTER